MADLRSTAQPLVVHLPEELIAELRLLAEEKRISLDDLVTEACAAYTEPYTWERCYKEWLRAHPGARPAEYGIDGDDLTPPPASGGNA
jgi:hypothetical protein